MENKFLVRPRICLWTARKLDKTATREAKERAAAGSKANVKLYKTILAADELDAVQKIATAARTEHQKRTVPWAYDGPGAITAEGYPAYKEAMAAWEAKFYAAVTKFYSVYDREREAAREYLQGLFNPADYPSTESIKGKFAFSVHCEPIPTPESFVVVGLPEADAQQIREDIVTSNRDAIENANNVAWARVVEKVEMLHARLSEYTAGTVTKFYDSWVDNIKEIADLIPSINIANDPDLKRMGQKLKMLTAYPAAKIKENTTIRNEVVRQATLILGEISDTYKTAA